MAAVTFKDYLSSKLEKLVEKQSPLIDSVKAAINNPDSLDVRKKRSLVIRVKEALEVS